MSAENPLWGEYQNIPYQGGEDQTKLGPFYFVFGAYFGLLIGVGIVAFRKKLAAEAEARRAAHNDDEAELKAHYGGRYHPILIALTIFSSAFSGYTVVGVPQTTLDRGYMVLMFFAGTCAQSIGMLWFFPRLRRIGMARGYMSPGDFVADRYRHKGITALCVLASSLPQFIYLAVQLASFGEALNSITKGLIPKDVGITCCIVVMLTMEVLGGMHSVVLTDIVQAVIMLVGFFLLALVMIFEYNVFSLGSDETCSKPTFVDNPSTSINCFTGTTWNITEHPQVQYGCIWDVSRTVPGVSWDFQTPLNQVQPPLGLALTAAYFWFVTNFFVFSCNPHLIQRLYLAEKDEGIKKVAQLLIFSPFFAMTPGVLAGVLLAANWPDWGARGECGTAFGVLAGQIAGSGNVLYGVLVIVLSTAALAAIMSSADSVILGVSNSVCVDIYKNMVNRTAETKTIVRMGQAISVFMCFVCYFFALQISNKTFFNWLSVQNGILFQVGPAIYYGLWRDFPAKAIFRGIVSGFIALVIVLPLQLFTEPGRMIFTLIAGPSVAAIINIMVVHCNRCTADADEEETEYSAQLASRYGAKLTLDKIGDLMIGTVEPNSNLLRIAMVMLLFTVPWYSWEAKFGIIPGWALIVALMTLLCTIVIFMAASSWKPKDNEDGDAEHRQMSKEMSKLGQSMHIDQTQAAF